MQTRHNFELLFIFTVVLSLTATVVKSEPYVKKPIPNGPNAKIGRSWAPMYRKFYQREIVEAYRKHGFHDPKWDADAIKFLDHFTKVNYKNDRADAQAFYKEGKALIDAGCNDPMVLFAYGAILFEDGRKLEAESPLERCIEGFKKSSYHKCRARWAPLDLIDIRRYQKQMKDEDLRDLCDLALQWTIESFRDGSYQNGEQRIALENFCRDYQNGLTIFRNKYSDVLVMLEKNRPTDPYIDKVTRGICHLEKGWEARGGGWSYTVTDEGWKNFEKELSVAQKLFKEAWKLRPELPEAPHQLMRIARSGNTSGETPRMWFDRVVAAQMDYMVAYSELMFSMSEVWGDDMNGLYEFGIECVKTGRYDTGVPLQFIAALKNLSSDVENKSYWTTPKTIKYLDIMYDGYEKAGTFGTKEYLDSQRSATAWYCERYALAKEILVKLGDKVDEAPFTRIKKVPFSEIKGEILAFASSQGPELVKAEALIEQKNHAEALAIYEKVSKIKLGDDLADRFVEEKTRKLRADSSLSAGEWADLPLNDVSKDWYIKSGNWTYGSDGWLRGSDAAGWLHLQSKSIFTQAMEMEVEIDFGDSPSKNIAAGIGFLPLYITGSDAYLAQISPDKKQLDIKEDLSNNSMSIKGLDIPQLCKLRIQLWAGIINVYLNDKPVKTGYLIPTPMDVDGKCKVVISAHGTSKDAAVGFRNLKLLRLTSKPSGMEKVEPWDMEKVKKQLGLE